MHIAIDAREAAKSCRTGKGQWAYGFWQELKKRNMTLTMCTGSHIQTICRLLTLKPDLYISPTSYIVPALIGRWIPCAIIVHDLIAFRNEPHNVKAKWVERCTLKWALKYAKFVFTVSEATKRDLLEKFPWVEPAKIKTIYAGHSQPSPSPFTSLRQGFGRQEGRGKQPYILCVGTLCPRKNQLRLIEAFESIQPSPQSSPFTSLRQGFGRQAGGGRLQLILAGGRGWHDDKIVQKAKNTIGVTWLGHVADDQYQELLEFATLFALPSLYEGFGIAVLDAMQHGIPVLTSDRGSLQEIAGDAAIYVDPENINSIAEGLERLLEDENLRNDLKEKGKQQAQRFIWKRTVDLFARQVGL